MVSDHKTYLFLLTKALTNDVLPMEHQIIKHLNVMLCRAKGLFSHLIGRTC